VQYNSVPTTRYLVELGPLKGAFDYPRNFHFETAEESKAGIPISAKDYDVIVLTNAQFADPYRTRVAEGTVQVRSSPPPSCLLMLSR
jgi:hypothetical protein